MTDENTSIAKTISLADLTAAMASIGGGRTDVPDVDDLYEKSDGNGYIPWGMPKISSALVANKVEANGPGIVWSVPGDYKKTVELYVNEGGRPQRIIPTDLFGTLIDCEIRPSRRGNEGEAATSSVIGVCKDGVCLRQLPNIRTGLLDTIYEYSDNDDERNTKPSKVLASLKWKPVTPEGLLEDLIRQGRSTATVVDKRGVESIAVFENRGMAYMHITHVAVRTLLATDPINGGPKLNKMQQQREQEIMDNLITTKRRMDKKVHTDYSFLELYPMSELMDENGEPLQPMFLALNMSNSAMKSYYNGGLASIYKYARAIMDCKGLRAPADRTLTEDEATIMQAMNGSAFYKNPFAWTTMVSLGSKEVKTGTHYSMPHFEGFDPTGNSLYVGKEHETWGDGRGIGSLNVTYLSDKLRELLRYNPTDPITSSVIAKWEAALTEAGFTTTPEEFSLDDVVGDQSTTSTLEYTAYREVPTTKGVPPVREYIVERTPDVDDDEDDIY